MKVRTVRILLLSLLLVFTGFRCNKTKHMFEPGNGQAGVKDRKLDIGIYEAEKGTCAVDFPITRLSRDNNHTAGWYSADGLHHYEVEFPGGSPFASGGRIATDKSTKVYYGGKLSNNAAGYYPYNVHRIVDSSPPSDIVCKKAVPDDPKDYDPGVHVTP
jgi:hypothetical protein